MPSSVATELGWLADGEEVVDVRGGEALHRVGCAVVDFHLALIFQNHAAGKDDGTAKTDCLIRLFGN